MGYVEKSRSALDSSGTVLFLQELDVSSTAVACFCHLYHFSSTTVMCTLLNTCVRASLLAFAVNLRLSAKCEPLDCPLWPELFPSLFEFAFFLLLLLPMLFSPFLMRSPCCLSIQAVEEFLGNVRSREQPHSAGLVSQPTAVKFLRARKFDVIRAVELFQAYKVQILVAYFSPKCLIIPMELYL